MSIDDKNLNCFIFNKVKCYLKNMYLEEERKKYCEKEIISKFKNNISVIQVKYYFKKVSS